MTALRILIVLLASWHTLRAETKKEQGLAKGESWMLEGSLAALRDPYDGVKVLALEQMAKLKNPQTATAIAEFLQPSYSMELRTAALRAYAALGTPDRELLPQIAEMLKARDDSVREAAVNALGATGQGANAYLPQLVELFKDPQGFVREAAVHAVGATGEAAKAYLPQIIELFKDPEAPVRRAAAAAFGATGEAAKAYLPQLIELFNDTDGSMRQTAAEAFGATGEAAGPYLPQLVELFKDTEEYVRDASERAFGQIGAAAKAYLPRLVELFEDREEYVRDASVRAFGATGKASTPYLPQIVELFKDPGESVREAAVDTAGMTGEGAKPYLPQIVELLKDPQESVRNAAVRAFAATGDAAKAYLPQLAEWLKDPNEFVRKAALSALGATGEAANPYLPQIAERLKDPNESVCEAALSALGATGEAANPYLPQIAELLEDPKASMRAAALSTLGATGEAAKAYLPKTVQLFKDPEASVREAALIAVGATGEAAKAYLPQIDQLFEDPEESVREAAVKVVERAAPLTPLEAMIVLNPLYYSGGLLPQCRFTAHYSGGGSREAEILIGLLGRSQSSLKDVLGPEEYRESFALLIQIIRLQNGEIGLKAEAAKRLTELVRVVEWRQTDIELLQKGRLALQPEFRDEADALGREISDLKSREEWRKWLDRSRNTILIHAGFWVLLIFFYPVSGMVQAIFFWNPWIRRIMGLGYVGFALTWVPFLRRRLLAPFHDSLLADAGLHGFRESAYFAGSFVRDKVTGEKMPVHQAVSELRKQVILIGESGLGKTMFLRHLAYTSRRIIVYLPAEKCKAGVMEAIHAKVIGQARDASYLRNLIWAGALDIYVDGLNEVTAGTRESISRFAESYFRGNILMATQPIDWRPPATARVYVLEPLERDQISKFLWQHEQFLRDDAVLRGTAYRDACERYLNEALRIDQPNETLHASMRSLSNPMDLTIVGDMIARDQHPDIFHLQQQQYDMMAAEFAVANGPKSFPLKEFSEMVYHMRLVDQRGIPSERFDAELVCMEQFKMVLRRQESDAKRHWTFRHDKVMDFFIVQAFLGSDNSRSVDHLADPRFRGVYFQLAALLPYDEALTLREKLVQYAADTKDHTVSDTFVQLLRPRQHEAAGKAA
jgi:HEAT repeat protein